MKIPNLPLRDRCQSCGTVAPTDQNDLCQDCALQDSGLGLDQPEVCRNGWTVQQAHILGTAQDEQETLFK